MVLKVIKKNIIQVVNTVLIDYSATTYQYLFFSGDVNTTSCAIGLLMALFVMILKF